MAESDKEFLSSTCGYISVSVPKKERKNTDKSRLGQGRVFNLFYILQNSNFLRKIKWGNQACQNVDIRGRQLIYFCRIN